MKIFKIKLTLAEINQLSAYIENRDREEWYYGNKEQFEKRHTSIKNKIQRAFEEQNQ